MDTTQDNWQVIVQGITYPVTFEILIQWIKEGRINPMDRVKKEGYEWIEACRVPMLASLFPIMPPNYLPLPIDVRPSSFMSRTGRNIGIVVFCISIALSGLAILDRTNNQQAIDSNNRGLIDFNKGNFDSAITDYKKAIESNPNFAVAYSNLGLAYYHKNDLEAALTNLDHALKLKPQLAEAYNNRGLVYRAKGDLDHALIDFNDAIKFKANDGKAYGNRGLIYYEKGITDKALADFNVAIKLEPNQANTYFNRGSLYKAQGNTNSAINDFQTALKLDKNSNARAELLQLGIKVD